MSEDTDDKTPHGTNDKDYDPTVAALMNLAGPRAAIPDALEKRVHAAVRQEWEGSTRRKTILRWSVPAALAATVLIAISFGTRSPVVTPQPIGIVASVSNEATAAATNLDVGSEVFAGQIVETADEFAISVLLAGDVSLRLATNSSLSFTAADEVTLHRGIVYADSGDRIYRDRHLTVHTRNGSATDIGTQFSVAIENDQLEVAVREGRVDVSHEDLLHTAEAGKRLTLQKGAAVVIDEVSPYDAYWAWAVSLAPEFQLENRSVLDFLKWAARETGKSLAFSADDVRMAAMRTEVFGSIEDLSPSEALEAVLATTEFRYRIDERSINISR